MGGEFEIPESAKEGVKNRACSSSTRIRSAERGGERDQTDNAP